MLVKVRPGATLSGAEQEFVDCLRSFPITCLAAIDIHVGDNGTRQIDAVLLTPRGITVVEVKGFRRRQSGILNVTDEGPWKISDTPADLDDETTTSPSDRLEQGVYAVRSKLERALLDPGHVCGVVVLVPFRGVVIRPARTNLRPGVDIVVANVPDSTELRIYVDSFSAAARTWTADRVVAAAQALGLENGPSRAELIADGFDATPPSVLAAVLPELQPKPKPVPGPSTKRQTAGGWAVLAIALLGMMVVFGVIISAWVRDTAGPGEQPGPERTTSVTPSPAPYLPKECWPLQTGC
ncbi:nuclease-related domain-containing protein [Nocardia sp. NPDC050710]|uniref:nuclease-related domain-containing protein n=1 Tax=Nocardia sp. NPDC050710 TaxID=3157220 RepID=UPI0033CDA00C